MTNYVIRKVATVQGLYDTNEETIYSDLATNPGSTIAEIVVSTSLAQVIVENILQIMVEQAVVKVGYSLNGSTAYYWKMVDWVDLIISNRDSARTWLGTHDGSSVDDMATDLSIPYAVAESLAYFLQREYSAVLTSQ